MAIASLSAWLSGTTLAAPHSTSFSPNARDSHTRLMHKNPCKRTCIGIDNDPECRFLLQPLMGSITSWSLRRRGLSLLPLSAASSSGSEQEEKGALETVLKLYSAIKDENIGALSDMIGDECRCCSNLFSFYQIFQGKQQVLDFFSFLIEKFGNGIQFVVKPTLHDGLTVGVNWRLESKTTHMPLGNGVSFYTVHVYQGKFLIRNVEMFVEPLLHIEPFRLKIMEYVTTTVDKIYKLSRDRAGAAVLALFVVVLRLVIERGMFGHNLVSSIRRTIAQARLW